MASGSNGSTPATSFEADFGGDQRRLVDYTLQKLQRLFGADIGATASNSSASSRHVRLANLPFDVTVPEVEAQVHRKYESRIHDSQLCESVLARLGSVRS